MRLLYVSQYFPPEMGAPAARVSELAAIWAQEGHEVTVLTGFPNHPTGKIHPDYKQKFRRMTLTENTSGIRVVRTWLCPVANRSSVERMVNYVSFFLSAIVRGVFLQRPDAIIGTSPQLLSAAAGWLLAKRFRRPFILEVRDLWPESLPASGVGTTEGFTYQILDTIASFLYKASDLVVVVAEPFRAVIAGKSPTARIDVVENGVEENLFKPYPKEECKEEFGLKRFFLVSYIGTVGQAHGVQTLLKAAATLEDRYPDLRFLIVGEGAEREELQKAACHLPNVDFWGERPRNEIPKIIGASDVCVVLLKNNEVFEKVLPTKILEFFACGRPVVAGVRGFIADLVEKSKAGIVIEPGSDTELGDAIERMHENRERLISMGNNGRNYVLEHYRREDKALQYLQIIKNLLCSVPVKEPLLKRPFDILLSGAGLLFSIPIWLVIAAAIKLEDGGAVFYSQDRVGIRGRRFKSWKFRSMRVGSDQEFGPLQASEKDPRVTRVGSLLRPTAADELPQLWNIFSGDMSFVGPRALMPEEIELSANGEPVPLTNISGFNERHSVRPGLTGVAQIYAPRDIPRRDKFRYDLLYIKRQSFLLDLKLIAMSFWITFRGKWEFRGEKI